MIDKAFDILLFILSAFIAAYLIVMHSAPWVAIAVYWAVNAVKNGRKAAG